MVKVRVNKPFESLPDPYLCDAEQLSLLSPSNSAEAPLTWWENTYQATLQGRTATVQRGSANLNIFNVMDN